MYCFTLVNKLYLLTSASTGEFAMQKYSKRVLVKLVYYIIATGLRLSHLPSDAKGNMWKWS